MSEMAKKAREAMKDKAKRLSTGDPRQKVDSSSYTPPEPLNTTAKTGMRPVSRRAYKKGGAVEGAACSPNMGRKPRKSGGRAEKADGTPAVDRYVNRDMKKANEYRDGIKHIGGMKKGGRTGKMDGGETVDPETRRRIEEGYKTPKEMPKNPPMPPRRPAEFSAKPADMSTMSADEAAKFMKSRKHGGRNHKAIGGTLGQMLSPALMLANLVRGDKDKKKSGGRTKRAEGGFTPNLLVLKPNAEKTKEHPTYRINADKEATVDTRYLDMKDRYEAQKKRNGGRTKKMMGGPMMGGGMMGNDPRLDMVKKQAMNFQGNPVTPGAKKGGKIERHPDEAMDKALIKKMVKPEARAKRQDGGGVFSGAGYPNKIPGVVPGGRTARKEGGRTSKSKGKGTNINIIISPGKDGAGGMPGLPPMMGPGLPPGPPPGMPPMMPPGGAPPMMPPPGPPPGMPMGLPPGLPPGLGMPRKSGGRTYRSYKDMDAGAGSGLGRLEKTEIQSRKR